MAKKAQAELEKEILEEAAQEAKAETPKESKLSKLKDAVKKDIASKGEETEEKTEAPEEDAKSEKDAKKAPKKKGKILDQAKEILQERKGDKEKEKEEVKYKDTRVKAGERVYTVPLYKKVSRSTRSRAAVHTLQKFVTKHTKAEKVLISEEVNLALWSHGMRKPPRSIRIVVSQDDSGRAVVRLK